jgi:hypothetical protein
MKFNLEEYETVEERIGRLYQNHPDARIVTELVSPADRVETAVFKAYVYLDGNDTPKATGYAMEKAGEGYVNKTSHVENCETSAIGRALANMGLHGNKRPSREEMEKAQRGHTEYVDYSRMDPANMDMKQLGQAIKQESEGLEQADVYVEEARNNYKAGDQPGMVQLLREIREKREQKDVQEVV